MITDIASAARPGTGVAAPPPPAHLQALAPLTPDEIRAAVTTVKADPELGPGALYETIELKEPTPAEFWNHAAGRPFPEKRPWAIT